ncbi:fasciclin-like arabinogalactan protein 21 [Phoenix dactylifera]|uniref:Fasciclin-like arabinogalactan protein 21 n=1 Tax=Phoenix dactylifera TaxID=42345 RepID=A0A8B9AG67_PHODC|nr:fasciclin-like arabinogalactan protein 21 [Phoenix dactylifera]
MAATAFSLLILFFLLRSSSAALSPSASAAGVLRSRGYSLMARVLDLAANSGGSLNGWNATGTLFAPTDSAFKHPRRRLYLGLPQPPMSPSPASLLYHTARSRALLYADLASRPPGTPIATLSRRRLCLFLRRAPGGELCLAESARPAVPCVRIRDPDLYLGGDLAIHGIDGVLYPTSASPCQANTWRDAAPFVGTVGALRRRGYTAVADAMEARRDELEALTAVTVFAPMDSALVEGFRGDLRHHVVPRRYHLHELARLSLGSRIETMAPGKTIAVGSNDGAVTVNGVVVDGEEIHSDDWAVVFPIHLPLRFEDSGTSTDSIGGAAISPSAFGSEVHSTSIGYEPTASPDSVAFDGKCESLDSSSGQDSVLAVAAVSVPSAGAQELANGEEEPWCTWRKSERCSAVRVVSDAGSAPRGSVLAR